MTEAKSKVLEKIKQAKINNLSKLDLSGEELFSIPSQIGLLENLKKLDISNNYLTDIPKSIENLKNLEELNISRNKFENFPKVICLLKNLKKLFINDNLIRYIIEELVNLENLIEFYIAGNILKELPPQIGQLHKLEILHLYDNRLKKIPSEIGLLKKLKQLFLYNNPIEELPEEIGNLTSLEYLNIIKNELKTLPSSIGRLEYIQRIDIEGNNLESPPFEILEQGIKAIKNYLNEKLEEGVAYIYEAKILVIGEGGAGKTSLCGKMLDLGYVLKSELESESTQGIDILNYTFDIYNGKIFTANLWDFGGQEIYHYTHQFFLTKRSLYLLVTDSRKDNTDLKYWLRIQELLGGESPIILIANEKNDREKEIDEKEIRANFSNVKEFFQTNLKTNRGFDNILKNINLHLQNLPHIGNELPLSWIKVRKAIEKLDLDLISLDRYISICKNNGIDDTEGAYTLSKYLHDLGVFLHFQDDLLLKRVVILNKEWGTEAVYKLFDHELIKINSGAFSNDDLSTIWNEPYFQGRYVELLNLMKKFKMCYEIENTGKYIVPEKLSHIKPGYILSGQSLLLKYTYKFMPKGVITRFIVNMHNSIKDNLVWKKGVVLKMEDATAEIIENYEGNEISIQVCQEVGGLGAEGLRSIIRNEIDKINASFNNLKVNKLIPCNCTTCENSTNPEFYKEEKLREDFKNGRKYKECDRSPYEKVDLRKLITISGIAIYREEEIKTEIKKLVSSNKFTEVFGRLIDFFEEDEDKQNQVYVIQGSHKLAVSNNRIDIIDSEEYSRRLNKIRTSIIELIDEV